MQTADTYRKLRFTLRFLLGNLDGFDPATDAVPYDQLPATDRSAVGSEPYAARCLRTCGSLTLTVHCAPATAHHFRSHRQRLPLLPIDRDKLCTGSATCGL